MKKIFSFSLAFFVLVLLLVGSSLEAFSNQHELNISLYTQIDEAGETEHFLTQELDMDYFFHNNKSSSARLSFLVHNVNREEDELKICFKNIYIKHSLDNLSFILGRQYAGWDEISFYNPTDFSPGSRLSLNNSSSLNKYENAVVLKYNMEDKFSIETQSAFLSNSEYKWGIRGNYNLSGHELTVSYVQEPDNNPSPLNRYGLGIRSEISSIDFYGMLALSEKNDTLFNMDNLNLTVGGYYTSDNDSPAYDIQIEYINIDYRHLKPMLGFYPLSEESDQDIFNFIAASASSELNSSSSIKASALSSIDDKSLLVKPTYIYNLDQNLSLNLNGTFFIGDKETILGPRSFNSEEENVIHEIIGAELSYKF